MKAHAPPTAPVTHPNGTRVTFYDDMDVRIFRLDRALEDDRMSHRNDGKAYGVRVYYRYHQLTDL